MKLVRTRQRMVMWIIDVLLTLMAWAGSLAAGTWDQLDAGDPRWASD